MKAALKTFKNHGEMRFLSRQANATQTFAFPSVSSVPVADVAEVNGKISGVFAC